MHKKKRMKLQKKIDKKKSKYTKKSSQIENIFNFNGQ